MENLDLSLFFQTRKEAAIFSKGLSEVMEALYRTDFHLEETLLRVFGLKKRDLFLTLLHTHTIATDNINQLKDFMVNMQEYITTLPVLSLTIAFEPTTHTLETIAQWFVNSLKTQVLLEITVDPHILAGATMNFKGKFIDHSIRPTFEKVMLETVNPTKPLSTTSQQSVEHITIGR